jgi:DNA-binding transcriptional ArsR family regulator
MKMEEEKVKEAYVILHPIRFRILELLSEKQMHVSELSKALAEERRLLSYHLDILEEYGFVQSKHEISDQPKSKGKALRIYRATDKIEQVLGAIKKM